MHLAGKGHDKANFCSLAGSGGDSHGARRVCRVTDRYINTVGVVFKSAQKQVMEWTPEKEAEQHCTDDMSVNGKGNITDAHLQVFCAA